MSVQRYAKPQMLVHWLTVILVLVQFLFNDGISEAFEAAEETGIKTVTAGVILHIASGMLLLGLTLYRLMLRRSHGTPPFPEGEPEWQKRIAHIVHLALIAVLLMMPLGGAAAWAGLSSMAAEAHEIGANLLFVILLVHIGAAFYGQYIAKRGTMDRMRPV